MSFASDEADVVEPPLQARHAREDSTA